MTKTIARYTASFGMPGFMPDSHAGLCIAHTRRELVAYIKDTMAMYDVPAYKFGDVHIAGLWAAIRRHGSSSYHVHIYHAGYVLTFHGLTEEEATELEAQEDF